MLASISSEELSEWMAYEHLEPFGARWETWQSGQICAVIANVNRPKGKRALRPTDFFKIEGHEPEAVESQRSIWAKAAMITEVYRAAENQKR